jgi:two-component system, NtrC family, sensor histidine kinase HydH
MANTVASTVSDATLDTSGGAVTPPSSGHARSQPTSTTSQAITREPRPDADAGNTVAPESPEQDITRWLRAQNAEISQLAGGLAHEIRNPLSTLSLNLDLLDEDFEEAESPRDRRIKQRVGRLKREVQRLYDILENFLRFARVQELKLAPTDLNALVEELCDFYEPQASTLAIVVRTYFSPDLPRPVIDADLFKQAVLNLMLNAEHAMAEGGELIMTTRRDGARIVLDVIDTGAGMPEDVQARIFDPFYSTRPGGSGLGLPTTRKIVEAHGGTIEVDSVPGKGSRFSLRLPVPPPSDVGP